MITNNAIDIAIKLIARFEGFRSKPYLCPANVPTIGFGVTAYADGKRVTLHDEPISEAAAYGDLRHLVKTVYAPAVDRLCPNLNNDDQAAALISFTYNLGVKAFEGSTLRVRVNANDWAGAVVQIKRWNKANGVVLKGLVRRRDAEAALLTKGTS
jgi:lysozyme